MENRKIYLLLMHTNTIPSRLVKLFTRYPYSHVGISLNKSCEPIYSFGRRHVNTILNGGLSIERKDGEFFSKFNKAVCRIYEKEVTVGQYEYINNKLAEMKQNIDCYKYDFLGIIPRFFNIPVTFENRYVCSYFIAELLDEADIFHFDKPNCLTKPKDFENLDGFKEIFAGSYLSYDENLIK